FQQLTFPSVPNLGTRASDVSHCKQIERGKAAIVLDQPREVGDDFRTGQILLLRYGRHRQVMLDQPDDQLRVLGAQTMTDAKAPGIAHAEDRVVSAAAPGNVVEHAGEI